MDKIDPVYLLLAYLLRLALIFTSLIVRPSSYIWYYWFNYADNTQMRADVTSWAVYLLLRFAMAALYLFHLAQRKLMDLVCACR